MTSYLNVECPVCKAARDAECTGVGVMDGLPHGERIEAADALELRAIDAAVDELA